MENRSKLAEEPAWKKLHDAFSKYGTRLNIYSLLKDEPKRFDAFRYEISLADNA